MSSGETSGRQNWPAIESNPEVLTNFIQAIGAPPTVAFHDVFGLDEELLAMIPQPVHAIILLHPGGSDVVRTREEAKLANCEAAKNIKPDSALAAFLATSRGKHPEERGASLQDDEGIRALHSTVAMQGQTDGNIDQESVNSHFVCFVHANGRVWELDGLKASPIDHGPASPATLAADAAAVVKREFIEKRPDSLNFSLLALGPAEAED